MSSETRNDTDKPVVTKTPTENLIEKLSLALLYLTSWNENRHGEPRCLRAWRSYDWDALDALQDADLVRFRYKAKSAYITEAGAESGEQLVELFGKALASAPKELSAPFGPAPDDDDNDTAQQETDE